MQNIRNIHNYITGTCVAIVLCNIKSKMFGNNTKMWEIKTPFKISIVPAKGNLNQKLSFICSAIWNSFLENPTKFKKKIIRHTALPANHCNNSLSTKYHFTFSIIIFWLNSYEQKS